MTDTESRAARLFAHDVANHEMTVLLDQGPYRHIRFRNPECGFDWFDLLTWPGRLAFSGDRTNHIFARVDDMFAFFRARSGWNHNTINPGYWAEKLTTDRDCARVYDQDVFTERVKEHVVDAIRHGEAPRGIGRAVRDEVLDDYEIDHEDGARSALERFEYKGWRFVDTWEWDFSEWDFHYLWACHAIQWGIDRYDAARVPAEAVAP